jgi:hypothetical protein
VVTNEDFRGGGRVVLGYEITFEAFWEAHLAFGKMSVINHSGGVRVASFAFRHGPMPT